MRRFALLLLAGCAGGGGAGADGDLALSSCSTDCPAGTRNSNYETVLRSGGGVATEGSCESYCEPITTCLAPQVPVITADSYECASVEGISSIPADDEVDFSFAEGWNPGTNG